MFFIEASSQTSVKDSRFEQLGRRGLVLTSSEAATYPAERSDDGAANNPERGERHQ
jgi:hypothetical protein